MSVTPSRTPSRASPSWTELPIVTISAGSAQLLDAHHHARFTASTQPPRDIIPQKVAQQARESTVESTEQAITIRFSTPPRDGSHQYSLGSADDADIKYGTRLQAVSGSHFLLGFNKKGLVIVMDISTLGSQIKYQGDHYKHFSRGDKKNPPVWVIPPNREVTLYFNKDKTNPPQLCLRAPAQPVAYRKLHMEAVENFHEQQNNPFPAIAGLGLDSVSRTVGEPSEAGEQWPGTSPKRGRWAWIFGKTIGMGAYGVVLEVFNSENWDMRAGKQMDKKDFAVEASILRRLNHPHIVRHIDEEIREGMNPVLVMEYCPLKDVATQHRLRKFRQDQVVHIFAQATAALAYLHSQKIAHRDIKPGNILVRSRSPKIEVAIGDFGLATKDKTEMSTQGRGTHIFMAPEVASEDYERDANGRRQLQTKYDFKADIWSMGLVALALLVEDGLPMGAGQGLSGEECDQRYAKYIVNVFLKDWLAGRQNDQFARLVGDMVRWDPARRPSAAECAERAAALVSSLQTTPHQEAGTASSSETQPAASEEPTIKPPKLPSARANTRRTQPPSDGGQATIKPVKRTGTEGFSQEIKNPPTKRSIPLPGNVRDRRPANSCPDPATPPIYRVARKIPASANRPATVNIESASTSEWRHAGSSPTPSFHEVHESVEREPTTVRASEASDASSGYMKELGLDFTSKSRSDQPTKASDGSGGRGNERGERRRKD